MFDLPIFDAADAMKLLHVGALLVGISTEARIDARRREIEVTGGHNADRHEQGHNLPHFSILYYYQLKDQ